ncbi:N-acetylglucosamine-6-phosphate deacetylase [Kosmotoga sp. DU53]|uniref:N-acetylglucosamine-6-phosphate deacetylase n=1 Tax=Kosmotoga sp. DU53 TaxID=1310160 RepID=UPI0007C50CA3|nr:N-acetylglucosamine-6-phosphate deacetylase [Kosmotoga sp. DU53]MDK2954300.1 N-acetylglucosamine-6-phosphate deacetylase [Kosmotoga sp.]OAA22552.1 N-acetylglucosamine-6-phosphate deacetylase [Kosmotoga sp. DU53]
MLIERVLIVDPVDGEYTGSVQFGEKIERIMKKETDYDYILMPGFIDPHTHGLVGIDTMEASKADYEKWINENFSRGVTHFLPTTVSASKADILHILKRFKGVRKSIGGLHLEGPFISIKKKGAQNPEHIRKPSLEELKEIITDSVRLITMAPEVEGFYEVLPYLTERDVRVSIGHSNAVFEDMAKAFQNNVRRITHFPNGLRALHHRELGVVGGALYLDFTIELIVDGVHSSPEFVDFTYRIKGADKIILITDSISATGLKDGSYTLGGLDVKVVGGKATLADGTLAGSTLTFDNAVKNFHRFTHCTLKELAMVSSYNAARDLGIDDEGRIKEGYRANFVLLDKELNVVKTVFEGNVVYKK